MVHVRSFLQAILSEKLVYVISINKAAEFNTKTVALVFNYQKVKGSTCNVHNIVTITGTVYKYLIKNKFGAIM